MRRVRLRDHLFFNYIMKVFIFNVSGNYREDIKIIIVILYFIYVNILECLHKYCMFLFTFKLKCSKQIFLSIFHFSEISAEFVDISTLHGTVVKHGESVLFSFELFK